MDVRQQNEPPSQRSNSDPSHTQGRTRKSHEGVKECSEGMDCFSSVPRGDDVSADCQDGRSQCVALTWLLGLKNKGYISEDLRSEDAAQLDNLSAIELALH